jgi:hypothetical protein
MMYRKSRDHDSTLRDGRIHCRIAAQRRSLVAHVREGLTTMARGVVVVYFSWFGKPLQTHHKVVLDLDAKAIARIKAYEFGGPYDPEHNYSGPLFFVPDDTLLLDEAACLGIRSPNDLYGGVVPHLFAKTKAITHGLVDRDAERPPGWSIAFAERVREIVLPGYTVFSNRDGRTAARRMLTRGPIRLKKPLSASGKDQTVVTTLNELDAVLETVNADEMAAYGLVVEENLRQVRTLSVGDVAVGNLRLSYYGTQRTVVNNEGRPVYGGSELVCVRGGWEALDTLPMSPELRTAVAAARRYDEATEEFHGFTASRRNYDVARGIGADGRPRSGVLEPSWRIGGASSAELMALTAFARDRSLEILHASHVEEYGNGRQAPADAIVDFQGDDPEAGPLLRYTIVKPQDQQLRRKTCGRCSGDWRGLRPPLISSDAESRVIPFRPPTGASHRGHRGKIAIGYFAPDDSPVPDLSKYECPESEDDYRHRMVANAIVLVFVSLLSLAGFWLVNAIAHS